MRPPKRAPIPKTKVAKSYKNSLTKWLYHTVLSHRSPGSLCYTDKGNLFDPLHPNNSIDILNTDLSTFPVVIQGEYVWQSKASEIGDYFYYSHHFDIWFKGETVMRN